jgi:hypothetical protein
MRWLTALSLVGLVACASSREATMTEAPTTVVGRAENAKGGAVVLTDGGPVYVEGLAAWDDALLHQRVRVTGVRRTKQLLPQASVDASGAVSQGAEGPQDVLERATWSHDNGP